MIWEEELILNYLVGPKCNHIFLERQREIKQTEEEKIHWEQGNMKVE